MVKKIVFSEEEIKKIIDLYNSGLSTKKVALEFNVSERKMFDTLTELGISRTISESKASFTKEEIKEIIELYEETGNMRQLAFKFNVKYGKMVNTIYKYVKNKPFIKLDGKINATKNQELECIEMFNNDIALDEIARKLNLSYPIIKKILYKHDLKRKRVVRFLYSQDDHFFDQIDTEAKSYFFGLLFADGTNIVSRNTIQIGLIEKDNYILESFLKEIKTDRPIYFKDVKSGNPTWSDQCSIKLCSEHMSKILESYGMVQRKSLIKKFPQIILDSSEDIQRHFIRGYFDGNGNLSIIRTYRHCIFGITSTMDMCKNINIIFKNRLEINDCIVSPKVNIATITTSKRKNVLLITNWLYKDCKYKLNRKYETYLEFKKCEI